MLINKTKDVADLSVTQGSFNIAHLSSNGRLGALFLQKVFYRQIIRSQCGDTIGCIEQLEAKVILLDAQVADLAKIPCVDVAPRVPLADHWLLEVTWKVTLIFVGLYNVAYPQHINVVLESASECLQYDF